LDEAGVRCQISKLDNGTHETIVNYEDRVSDEQWERDTLAVQGLIYHFDNRGWINYDYYMYIDQRRHVIRFNEEKKPITRTKSLHEVNEMIDEMKDKIAKLNAFIDNECKDGQPHDDSYIFEARAETKTLEEVIRVLNMTIETVDIRML